MADLDDAADLAVRDSGRLLGIARAGATVRQIASAGVWSAHADLHGDEIGSVGVIVSELMAPAYGDALAALSTRLGAPVAVRLSAIGPGDQFPRAADVLVLVSVNGLERPLLEALHLAASRGTTTVVAAPEASPLAVAAAERHATLASLDVDDPVTAWWAGVATLVAAFAGARALPRLADALDEAAALLGPVVESYENPAKQLAQLDEPLLVVAVDDDAALAAPLLVQELGARSRWSVRSVDVRTTFAELLEYVDDRATGAAGDLFYDPQIDGLQGSAPTRQLVLLSGATPPELAEDALQLAERIGTVRAVAFGPDERWSAVAQILLAQLSGTYYALAND